MGLSVLQMEFNSIIYKGRQFFSAVNSAQLCGELSVTLR